MIYLVTPAGAIACCEQEASAARLERKGFVRCSYEEWRDGWIDHDLWALALMRAKLRPAVEQARAVGEPWRAPWLLKDVPKERR